MSVLARLLSWPRVVVAAVVLIGAAAAGLLLATGSPGSYSHQVVALSKAGYIAQSDAICRSSSAALSKLQPPADPSDGHATAAYLRSAAQGVRAEMARLDALGAPPSDAATLAKLHTAQTAATNQLAAAAADYAAGHAAAGMAQLKPLAAGAQTLENAWQSYGFKTCGQLAVR